MDLEHINTEIADISKEVQMMRMCHHSNVLCCHASFVSKSELFLVTPLMEKGSCLRIMRVAKRQGRGEGLAEQWLGYVLFEILCGLGYLHDNGHIHRDIKAGNILLDPNGKAALSDFGVSSWLVHAGLRRRTAKTFVGTPCWMAPEVMEQVEGYDYKADIWSFGITALELAKGFAPYALHPPMKVLLLTIQEEPPSLRSYATEKSCTGESFSRSFKEMVRMCLQKEARKRPTVQTLMNCKFFKTKWPVGPLVNELLCHVGNISVMCRRFKLSNYFLQCIFFCCRYLMNPSPHKRVPCISRQMWVYQRLPRIYLSFGVFGLY
jgi:serine/threonine-protein kinase OSR1/STK39